MKARSLRRQQRESFLGTKRGQLIVGFLVFIFIVLPVLYTVLLFLVEMLSPLFLTSAMHMTQMHQFLPNETNPFYTTNALHKQNIQDLIEWISLNGGFVRNVTLGINQNGIRGLFALETFQKGDIIMKIPGKCQLFAHNDVCLHSEESVIVKEMKLQDESFFWPYLKALPSLRDYVNYHPIFLPRDMLNAFQPLTSQIHYQEMKNCCEGDTFKCHMAMVQKTRVYSHKRKKAILVPVADLANTCHKGMNTDWFFEADTFVMRAKRQILAGREIFDTYTLRGNIDLYRTWGFTFHDNPKKTKTETKGTCEWLQNACNTYVDDPRADKLLALAKEACPKHC